MKTSFVAAAALALLLGLAISPAGVSQVIGARTAAPTIPNPPSVPPATAFADLPADQPFYTSETSNALKVVRASSDPGALYVAFLVVRQYQRAR